MPTMDDTHRIQPSGPSDDIIRHNEPMPMDEDEFQRICEDALENAVHFVEQEIAPARDRSLRYYRGECDIKPLAGHSKQVTTEVRDVVEGMMPELMRTFTAGNRICEYQPSRPGEEEKARQLTEYVHHIYWKDNPGWLLTYSFFKNALVQKQGIFRAYRDDVTNILEQHYRYSGLMPEDFQVFEEDQDVLLVEQDPDSDDVRVVRKSSETRFRIDVVPPEDFVINRSAQSCRDFDLIGIDCYKPVSEIVAMGYDYNSIAAAGIEEHDDDDTNERESRVGYDTTEDEAYPDPAMERVRVAETFIYVDKDGDGIAELHKVLLVGSSLTVFDDEIVIDHDFAFASPYMFGNAAIGESVGDYTMDFQDVNTAVTRGILDNIYNVVSPLKGINERLANLKDLAENRDRGFVRAKDPNAIWNIETPFVADKALAVLSHFDRRKQERLGVNAQQQGLDAEHLQSSTERGVDRILTISQEKIQLVAALMANVAFVRLFQILNRLIIQHQDQERQIQINGTWEKMDPRVWNSDYSVEPTVGLGYNTNDKRIESLSVIKATQETIMAQMGLANPFVRPSQYANTLADLARLAGTETTSRYFVRPEQADQAAQAMMQQQSEQPDPKQMETQARIQKMQQEIELKKQKQQSDTQLKVVDMQTDAALEQRQQEIDTNLKIMELTRDTDLKRAELAAEAALEAEKIRVKAQVDTRLRTQVGD